MPNQEVHLTFIKDWYRTDIPRKTLLAWSLLLGWQNDNKEPLRDELEIRASVPARSFAPYVQEFCELGIFDNSDSCRLQTKNKSFDCVRELVEEDIGPLGNLPFNHFQFEPYNPKFMKDVWIKQGCQLLIDTWAKVPHIRHEVKEWELKKGLFRGTTIRFSTTTEQPDVIFYFTPKPHPRNKAEFDTLLAAKNEVIDKQIYNAGDGKVAGIIGFAAALSFGTGTFEGDTKVVMLGPITLMMIVNCFRQHPEKTAILYDTFIKFFHPITGQRDGIIKGAALMMALSESVQDDDL